MKEVIKSDSDQHKLKWQIKQTQRHKKLMRKLQKREERSKASYSRRGFKVKNSKYKNKHYFCPKCEFEHCFGDYLFGQHYSYISAERQKPYQEKWYERWKPQN